MKYTIDEKAGKITMDKEMEEMYQRYANDPSFNLLEKDEFGLYKHAENYTLSRIKFIASEKNNSQEKLDKIPKWIRLIFNAL